MTNKPIPVLLVFLVLLIGIAWGTGAFDSAPSTLEVPDVSFDASAVNRLDVQTSGLAVRVVRGPVGWTLELDTQNAPADSATVSRLLSDLASARLQSVVSRSADRYASYGVDSTATRIQVEGDGFERDWILSTSGPGASTGYLRIEGEDPVYSVTPRISVPSTLDRWREKRILTVSPASVQSLDIEGPDADITLESSGSGAWQLMSGGTPMAADSASVQRYLGRFNPLRVDGFLEASPDTPEPDHRLTFHLKDGTTIALSSAESGTDRALRVEGDATLYRINASRLGTLFPSATVFEPR